MRSSSRSGLSLVELIVALAVVAVALFAIAASQIGAFTASAQARQIADARDVATRGIADLRAAVIADVVRIPARWNEIRSECDAVAYGEDGARDDFSIVAFPALDPNAGPPPATSDCVGQYAENGIDGVEYAFRWVLGPPGSVTVADVAGNVDAETQQPGMIRLLVRLDWERRGTAYSLSFEDFVSCVDIDSELCPAGNG